MDYKKRTENLLSFIDKATSPFHVIRECTRELEAAGFQYLNEMDTWNLQPGGKYYVTRNGSSMIAFSLPYGKAKSFQMTAAHSDCPVFKLKGPKPFTCDGHYTRLSVEGYGGLIRNPWMDRPLSISGRMVVRKGDGVEIVLVDPRKDLVLIPNLPIHMNRDVNEGKPLSIQVDMMPLFGEGNAEKQFVSTFLPDTDPEDVLGMDLYLYNRTPGSIWGVNDEFFSAERIDDVQCAYGILRGLIESDTPQHHISVCCIFDNEEVGSTSKQGAHSNFLVDILEMLAEYQGNSLESFRRMLAGSFLVSADNAHACHPAHPEKYDPANRVYMNKGIVIKQSALQKYTTDAVSEAVTKLICKKSDLPYQVFANHGDFPGGSTLGSILTSQVSVTSVDIGMAQLAMHSPYETAGTRDTEYLVQFIRNYYNAEVIRRNDMHFDVEL